MPAPRNRRLFCHRTRARLSAKANHVFRVRASLNQPANQSTQCASKHIEENLLMKKFLRNLALTADARAAKECFVCKQRIANDNCTRFYRLPEKAGVTDNPKTSQILLCSSACAFRYFTTLENDNHEPNSGKIMSGNNREAIGGV
jgi:hypothetical protein